MHNLSKEYVFLFNTITELEQSLLELRDKLIAAQRQAEELYLSDSDSVEMSERICGSAANSAAI